MFMLRFLLSLLVTLAVAAILWTQSGPFAWVGGMQLALTDSYSVKLTLVLTVLAVLVPVGVLYWLLRRGKSFDMNARTGPDRATVLGVLTASLPVLAFGLAPLLTPRDAIPSGGLRDVLARATFVPAQAELSLAAESAFIDQEKGVSVSLQRHSSDGTIYAPIHAPGSTEVLGMVSGRENDWRNASIRALPFANEANAAAVANSRKAVLTLQPVPLIVRREWEEKGMPVPLFLPSFQWDSSPLAANVPLLVGGGTVTLLCLIALLLPRRPLTFEVRPPDL